MTGARRPAATDRRRGPRLAATAARAERDKALLQRLEHEFRRPERATWPDHFAKHVGFKGKASLKHYPETQKAVNAYGWKTAAHRMRGPRPAGALPTTDAALTAVDVGALALERDGLRDEVARLSRALADAQAERDHARTALQATAEDLLRARAMVDDLDAYLAHRDVVVAADLERRLHQLAASVTGHPQRPVQVIQPADANASPPMPRLRLIDGGKVQPGEANPGDATR